MAGARRDRKWLAARAALAAMTLALAMAAARADDAGSGSGGAPAALHVTASEPMRLGFPADRWTAEPETVREPQAGARCQRWLETARRLGETFAGHALRSMLASHRCSLVNDAGTSRHWDWPWSGLDRGPDLPPALDRRFGDWEMRCGQAGARRRCALVFSLAMAPLAQGRASPEPGLSTHFVIDRIAGREVLLWRLIVPLPAGRHETRSRRHDPEAAGELPAVPRAVGRGRESSWPQPSLAFFSGGVRYSALKPHCGMSACILEVGAERAGRVASDLAAGRDVGLEITHQSEPGAQDAGSRMSMPGRHFAEGFAELVRRRHRELADGEPR